ncbi:hypothetical protein RYX36_033576, partial [Vicia faba]
MTAPTNLYFLSHVNIRSSLTRFHRIPRFLSKSLIIFSRFHGLEENDGSNRTLLSLISVR